MPPVANLIVGLLIVIALFVAFVFLFRWLWNTTMPEVFDTRRLSFAQALKILLLAGILFGGHRVINLSPGIHTEPPTDGWRMPR